MIQQALQNIEGRVDQIVSKKVANLGLGDNWREGVLDSKQWAIREKRIMEIIDSQGSDIAIDCARMEG